MQYDLSYTCIEGFIGFYMYEYKKKQKNLLRRERNDKFERFLSKQIFDLSENLSSHMYVEFHAKV